MTVRKSSVLWLALGIILIIAAVLVRFVFLPSISKLPKDLNQSQNYAGTAQALNPKAFATNDIGNLITPKMPITAVRSIAVDAVDGDTAIVTSKSVLSLPGGAKQNDVHTYAVSRVDYTPVALTADQAKSLVPAAQQATFEAHHGVAFSWPMNPPKNGTALYDTVTRTAQAATFTGEDEVNGRTVDNFTVDAGGPITEPSILAQFAAVPKALPKAAVAGLLQAGIVPASSRDALGAALPSMPDVLPVSFYSTNLVKLAVDQQFGAPIKADSTQSMYAAVTIDGKNVPVLPLSIMSLHTTPDSAAQTANTLAKNAKLLSLIGVWLPIALAIIGLALIALAVVRWRTPAPAPVVAASPETTTV